MPRAGRALVAVCCSITCSFAPARADGPRFEIQAHRGAGLAMPENTLESFRWAWQHGVTPEADLRTTADGGIICFHDPDLARVVSNIDDSRKKTAIEKLPLAEVEQLEVGSFRGPQYAGQRVPAVDAVLADMEAHPERLLYLDIKTADLDKLVDMIHKHRIERQVIFTTTHYKLIRDWKKRVPQSLTLLWNGDTEENLKKKLDAVRKTGFEGVTHLQIHVHVHDLAAAEPFDPSSSFLRELGQELKSRGIVFQVLPWECDDPRAYEKLLQLGAASFATDYPEVTLKAVADYCANHVKAQAAN
jgi:glycerophosphoryl diester phosphodiesterase